MECSFGPQWFMALGSILLIDLLLSGDNALVIAMASRKLPPQQRWRAAVIGTVLAVAFRVGLTLVTTVLLEIPYLQFIGGIALIWIAIKLLCSGEAGKPSCGQAGSLYEAIKIIVVADFIMSLDNILALAAVAHTVPGSKYLLILIGLAVSIPLVVFGAQLLMKLMDRFSAVEYFGAGVLGYAAAKMIIHDKIIGGFIGHYDVLLEFGLIIAVLVVGHWRKKQGRATKL